jgi:TorA maturation chaperone TorD
MISEYAVCRLQQDSADRDHLQGAATLFDLLGKLLSSEMNQTSLESLLVKDLFAAAPYATESDNVQQGLKMLKDWQLKTGRNDSIQELKTLNGAWFNLFAGAGRPAAPPWESFYTDRESLLFTDTTIDVRRYYERHGLQIVKINNEPDDHIGIMLSFLAFLTQEAIGSLDDGDISGFSRLQKEQREFINSHILTFISQWCELVCAKSTSSFYSGLSLIAQGAVYFHSCRFLQRPD